MTAAEMATYVVVAAAVPANLFPILYTVWKNWWNTPEGRHLFFFVTGFAALIDLSLPRRWFGPFELYEPLVLLVYLWICYQLYRRLWLLVRYNGPRALRTPRAYDPPRRRATDVPDRRPTPVEE